MLANTSEMPIIQLPLERVLGAKTAKKLLPLKLHTVNDLLHHYPRRYAYRGEITPIDELTEGSIATVLAKVVKTTSQPMRARRGYLVKTIITDGKQEIELVFFPRNSQLANYYTKLLHPQAHGIFSGKITNNQHRLQLSHPQMDLFEDSESQLAAITTLDFPIPIYPLTQGINTTAIWKSIKALLALTTPADFPEIIPPTYREEHQLPTLATALTYLHTPENNRQHKLAYRYLRHREAFLMQTALAKRRNQTKHLLALAAKRHSNDLLAKFDANLPWPLSASQSQVGKEISIDLANSQPMQRLLQGDVGSGKTIVALRAMLQVVQNNGQCALLVPTEVIAQQHFLNVTSLLGNLLAKPLATPAHAASNDKLQATVSNRQVTVSLLTASLSLSKKKQTLLDIASGKTDIIIGTHALLAEKVQPPNLQIVVVDEQHRFGVDQRNALNKKAKEHPHMLVMSATPIPRTIAQTVFGDLDVSYLYSFSDKVGNRKTYPVFAKQPGAMARAWQRAREEIANGGQVFVICPRITADDDTLPDTTTLHNAVYTSNSQPNTKTPTDEIANVIDITARIKRLPQLAGLRIASLHGQLKLEEKNQILQQFQLKQIDILVSTTVIEVGIDIPDASMMVILDADRFGIAQLHQIRGRVGRGDKPGLCLAVTNNPHGSLAWERLNAFANTHNGFTLADIDIQLRSEGDVLGSSQAGYATSLRLLRITRDAEIIAKAKQAAFALVELDPSLSQHQELATAIDQLLSQSQQNYLTQG